MFDVKLTRYSDPERKYLAHSAAVYLGKPDTDNVKRPLSIIRKGDTLAIFRGEHARFELKTTKVVYDHLITYTTQNMRACGGAAYQALVHGIDLETNDPVKKKRLQAARSVAPMSVQLHYVFEFNLGTLIEAIFPQRIWTPGAQQDTKKVVQKMYELVHAQDPELWDLIYDFYGPEAQAWKKIRQKLRKEEPELFAQIMSKYGIMKSMWE
jgi:hypothetical protein